MANSVDLVIGSEAIKQVESLISKLSLADAELLKISQSAMGASKGIAGIAGISTPSGLDKTVSNTTALNAQLEKQNAIITKLHADIAKKAEQSRLSEIRLQQQRERAFDNFEKNAQKEAALNTKNEGAYQRIQNSVNLLTKAYNDLAIKKQLGGTLTAKEDAQLASLTTRISTYQKALLATDATIGKNQRNVGNYASGYNALGNSINQLSREAPAFANSVNTGFMALSNNFPALFDAINGIRDKNKMLVAEGKTTVSVLKSIAGAVFSWQTLLSVGVTLLTLYGGKIVEFAGNLMKGKEATKSLAENQELLNDALKENSGSYAEEKVNIEVLYKTATNLNASYKDRKRAVDELQDLYPFYFKNLADEAIMTGEAKNQYDLLSKAIITVAKARASEEILQKRETERLVSEQEDINKTMKLYGNLSKAKGTSQTISGGTIGAGSITLTETKEQQKTRIRKEIQELRQQSIKQREQWAKEDAFFIQKIAEGNAIEQTLKPAEKAKTAKKATQEKNKQEDLDHLESYVKPVGTIVDEINAQIEQLKIKAIVGDALSTIGMTDKELEKYRAENAIVMDQAKKDLSTLISLKKSLNALPVGGALPDFVVPETQAPHEKLKSDWKETFNSIAENAQKAGDIIAEFSQRNFENEYRRLDAQKDISLKFAGDSAAAKQKIEEDYEKKRKDIANRENKAKQKQAIFNIAIDTAQAIVATLAKTPPPAGLPLAFVMGALGAAQIALVASQKIPQYFDGTDNHIGGMMLVNDGAGSNYQEKVILPNGKEIMPEGRNVLMNAPKGTKVLTHEQQIMQMLNERGISMHANYSKNNGMTANEMDGIMSKHFAKIQTNTTTIDKRGFSQWTERNGNRTIQNNNRVSRTGFKI